MREAKDYDTIIANARLDGLPEDVIADIEEERMLSQNPSYLTWDELHELEDDGLNGGIPRWIGQEINGRKFRVYAPLIQRKGLSKKKLLKKVSRLDGVPAFFEFTSELLSNCVREEVNGKLASLSPKELNPIHNKGISEVHSQLLRMLVRDFYQLSPFWNFDSIRYSIPDVAFLDQLIDATGILDSFLGKDVLHIAELELIALLKQFAERLVISLVLKEPPPDHTLELEIKALAPPLILNPQIQPNSPNVAA